MVSVVLSLFVLWITEVSWHFTPAPQVAEKVEAYSSVVVSAGSVESLNNRSQRSRHCLQQ